VTERMLENLKHKNFRRVKLTLELMEICSKNGNLQYHKNLALKEFQDQYLKLLKRVSKALWRRDMARSYMLDFSPISRFRSHISHVEKRENQLTGKEARVEREETRVGKGRGSNPLSDPTLGRHIYDVRGQISWVPAGLSPPQKRRGPVPSEGPK
jgi:hypothetical protein